MRNGSTVGLSQSSGAGLLRKSSLSGTPRLRSIFPELGRDFDYKLQAELLSVNRGLKVVEERSILGVDDSSRSEYQSAQE